MTYNDIVTMFTVTAMAAAVALPSVAQSESQTGQMTQYADMGVVEGSTASLARLEHGVYATADTTGLTPGEAITLLWVVFNDPAQCSGGACGADDIFNISEGQIVPNDDGSPPMNAAGISAVGISLLRADGRIVDADGSASFRSHLPLKDVSEAGFGPGLLDAQAAEIHLVLRSHGTPGQNSAEMLNSINGGCAEDWPNLPCKNVQFSVFPSQ